MMLLLSNKQWVYVFVMSIGMVLCLSFLINVMDYPTNNNDVIRQYQLNKIRSGNKNIDTIFFGDSSCGNAIDAKYFDKLANTQSVNLALTGSFGIEGSLNMIRRAVDYNKNIRNIIIIQTLDIWRREFSYIGFFDTLTSIRDLANTEKALDKNLVKHYITYIFNPKELLWLAQWLLGEKHQFSIDQKYDFLRQNKIKYSNGLKTINITRHLISPFLNEEVKTMYTLLDKYCKENDLNCIYMHGPIIDKILQNSEKSVEKINRFIMDTSKTITPLPTVFSFPQKMIGDAPDHIAPTYKKTVTEEYFHQLKPYLSTAKKKNWMHKENGSVRKSFLL